MFSEKRGFSRAITMVFGGHGFSCAVMTSYPPALGR